MAIDVRPTRKNLRDWQRKSEHVPQAIADAMRRGLRGDETDDFYLGLVAGLAAAAGAHVAGVGDSTIQLLAVVADLCDRKELA